MQGDAMADSLVVVAGHEEDDAEGSEGSLMGPLAGLSLVEPSGKRVTCETCRRPAPVCWCHHLPPEPLRVQSRVVILQHPGEARRGLRTVPMLVLGLAPGTCSVHIGRSFPSRQHVGLSELLQMPDFDPLLLFPGPKALRLSQVTPVPEKPGRRPYLLILLDGTWTQAKALLAASPALQNIPQVCLEPRNKSAYVIRTQPSSGCLSTLEAASETLAQLEGRPMLAEQLQRPLLALCRFQLEKGASHHHSKQERISLSHPTSSTSAPGKRTRRLLARLVSPEEHDSAKSVSATAVELNS